VSCFTSTHFLPPGSAGSSSALLAGFLEAGGGPSSIIAVSAKLADLADKRDKNSQRAGFDAEILQFTKLGR
jgi:hypothetical protein